MFKETLLDAGYEDAAAVDLLKEGAPLTGQVPTSGVFPKAFRPAKLTRAALEEQAPTLRKIILATTRSSGDSECDLSCGMRRSKKLSEVV